MYISVNHDATLSLEIIQLGDVQTVLRVEPAVYLAVCGLTEVVVTAK